MAVFHDTVFKVVGVNIKAEDAFTYDDDVSKHIIEKTGCMNHIVPLLLSVVNVCALSLISDQASPFLLPLHYDFFSTKKGVICGQMIKWGTLSSVCTIEYGSTLVCA